MKGKASRSMKHAIAKLEDDYSELVTELQDEIEQTDDEERYCLSEVVWYTERYRHMKAVEKALVAYDEKTRKEYLERLLKMSTNFLRDLMELQRLEEMRQQEGEDE